MSSTIKRFIAAATPAVLTSPAVPAVEAQGACSLDAPSKESPSPSVRTGPWKAAAKTGQVLACLASLFAASWLATTVPARTQTPPTPCTTSGALPADASEGLTTDCQALWAFYRNLTGREALATGDGAWGAGTTLANWTGVVVSAGRIERLRVSAKGLEGSISPQLGNVTELEELYLNNNQLTGAIPVDLQRLTKLTTLFLGGNEFSGAIPDLSA